MSWYAEALAKGSLEVIPPGRFHPRKLIHSTCHLSLPTDHCLPIRGSTRTGHVALPRSPKKEIDPKNRRPIPARMILFLRRRGRNRSTSGLSHMFFKEVEGSY